MPIIPNMSIVIIMLIVKETTDKNYVHIGISDKA